MPVWSISIIFIVGVVFAIQIVGNYIDSVNKKKGTKNDIAHKSSGNLEHTTCVDKNLEECFHVDGKEYSNDRKICNKCGHRNEKTAKTCSVCGHKLPWF